jgi:tetratricopeptide (TPR) repeat protein
LEVPARTRRSVSQSKQTVHHPVKRKAHGSAKVVHAPVHSRKSARKTVTAKSSTKSQPESASAKGKSVAAKAVPAPVKATSLDDPDEPRTPPGYETQTQLLARAYRLRDQALNEQLKGDHGLAVKHLLDATQLTSQYYGKSTPQEALLYFDLGVAASQAEQNELARQSFQQCLERNPDMSEAQMRLAMVLARQGKQAEALSYARQAVELQPEDSRAHLVLSLLLERQGHAAEAKAEKDKARRLAKSAGITTPKELLESVAPLPNAESEPLPDASSPGAPAPSDSEPDL